MRSQNNHSITAGAVVIAMLCCGIFLLLGLGYIWQKGELIELGREMKSLELRHGELAVRRDALQHTMDALSSTPDIDARVKRSNLGLITPQPDQIVRLSEFPSKSQAGDKRYYAATPYLTQRKP